MKTQDGKVNVLVIGGGGREHALADRLIKSPRAGNIYVCPGNPGTTMSGCHNLPKLPFHILADLTHHLDIGLVVIGPDNALAEGATGIFMSRGVPVFGPTQIAAQIESNKAFAKTLMRHARIPTADFEIFTDPEEAMKYARSKNGRVCVKASGLALGKGAFPCHSVEEAESAIRKLMIERVCGDAGLTIVIEDLLEGVELSVHAFCDGTHVRMMPFLRDHKHLFDGNQGPMTGGMGVCGPVGIDTAIVETIEQKIVVPCVQELLNRGTRFVGCLYPGLMLTKDGPKVLEFNARFGDPETQVLMRLLHDDVDLIEVLLACTTGQLDQVDLRWKSERYVCIVMASAGYPGTYASGKPIEINMDRFHGVGDPVIYHAGTCWKDGKLHTSGGRVLGLTCAVPNDSHTSSIYSSLGGGAIQFAGQQYRADIGRIW